MKDKRQLSVSMHKSNLGDANVHRYAARIGDSGLINEPSVNDWGTSVLMLSWLSSPPCHPHHQHSPSPPKRNKKHWWHYRWKNFIFKPLKTTFLSFDAVNFFINFKGFYLLILVFTLFVCFVLFLFFEIYQAFCIIGVRKSIVNCVVANKRSSCALCRSQQKIPTTLGPPGSCIGSRSCAGALLGLEILWWLGMGCVLFILLFVLVLLLCN